MLKPYIKRALNGQNLSEDEMAEAVGAIMDGVCEPAAIAGLLVALRAKGETADEIAGAARAMRQRMNGIAPNATGLLDTCGTGGDGANTFNLSTAVAFIVAASGIPVAKHGNRAVSSKSGSADVLARVGVNIDAPPEVVTQCIDEVGLGFLFAPNHHPAMRHAGPVRKALGVRTLFNVLGPLTNPAGAEFQLLGVFDRALVPVLATVLGRLGCQRAWVVHGEDGLDEVTVCGRTFVAEWNGSQVIERVINPSELGLGPHALEDLRGGTAEENAEQLTRLLQGAETGPLFDAVALGTAAALAVVRPEIALAAHLERASSIIRSGNAYRVLQALIRCSNRSF